MASDLECIGPHSLMGFCIEVDWIPDVEERSERRNTRKMISKPIEAAGKEKNERRRKGC